MAGGGRRWPQGWVLYSLAPPGVTGGRRDRAGLAHSSQACRTGKAVHTVSGSHKEPLWATSQTGPLCFPMPDCAFGRILCVEHRDPALTGQRRMPTLFLVTGPPVPLGLGEGQGQQPHTIAPGTKGVWGREEQWEGQGWRAFSGRQAVSKADFLEQPTLHAGSNLQLGSRLQLAGMRLVGTCDLPLRLGWSWGDAKAGITVPGVQLTAAGSWAIPAGFSPSFSVQVPGPGQNVVSSTQCSSSNQQGRKGQTQQLTYGSTEGGRCSNT